MAACTEAELYGRVQQLQQLEGERDSLSAQLQSRQAEVEDRDAHLASLQQVSAGPSGLVGSQMAALLFCIA